MKMKVKNIKRDRHAEPDSYLEYHESMILTKGAVHPAKIKQTRERHAELVSASNKHNEMLKQEMLKQVQLDVDGNMLMRQEMLKQVQHDVDDKMLIRQDAKHDVDDEMLKQPDSKRKYHESMILIKGAVHTAKIKQTRERHAELVSASNKHDEMLKQEMLKQVQHDVVNEMLIRQDGQPDMEDK
jgi:F0F1-type ATP synthase membrane subunit b/b'